MAATAYLVAYLRHNPKINGQAVAHVGIKSEGAAMLTGDPGSTYADLLRCDGKDYQDAIDNVLATVRQYRHLHWTLPWIDSEAWPSEKRAAFIREVQESFREPTYAETLEATAAAAALSSLRLYLDALATGAPGAGVDLDRLLRSGRAWDRAAFGAELARAVSPELAKR